MSYVLLKEEGGVHCANVLARASWKEHTSMIVGSCTGTRSSASRSCWIWSRGTLADLSTSMLLKMCSLDGVLLGEVALGDLAGVVMGVVNLYGTTGTGFVLVLVVDFASLELLGRCVLADFRSVTDEYGCKLRKGLVSLGLLVGCGTGVVDTFLACFFFFLFSLLCVIHGLSIDY